MPHKETERTAQTNRGRDWGQTERMGITRRPVERRFWSGNDEANSRAEQCAKDQTETMR